MDDNGEPIDSGAYSPTASPGVNSSNGQQGNPAVSNSLLISHAVSGNLGLEDSHRDALVEFAQYFDDTVALPVTAGFIYLAGSQFKVQEETAALRQEVAVMQENIAKFSSNAQNNFVISPAHKSDLLVASKIVLYSPTRISYSNDAVIADVYKYLKENAKQNTFTQFFSTETTSTRRVFTAAARSQASYAKTTLKDTWMELSLDLGITAATEQVAKAMLGSSEAIGAQHTSRLLLVRRFCRERNDRILKAKARPLTIPTTKTRNKNSKRKKRGGDNFSSTQSIENSEELVDCESNNGSDEEVGTIPDFWTDFDRYLKGKIDGKSEGKGRKRQMEGEGEVSRGWGKTFKSKEWMDFYEECIVQELLQHPEDTIPSIPRTRPQVNTQIPPLISPVSAHVGNGISSSVSDHRSHISVAGNAALFQTQTRSNTPTTPLSNQGFAFPGSHLHVPPVIDRQLFTPPPPGMSFSSPLPGTGSLHRANFHQSYAPSRPPPLGLRNILLPDIFERLRMKCGKNWLSEILAKLKIFIPFLLDRRERTCTSGPSRPQPLNTGFKGLNIDFKVSMSLNVDFKGSTSTLTSRSQRRIQGLNVEFKASTSTSRSQHQLQGFPSRLVASLYVDLSAGVSESRVRTLYLV
ncbi:hypothetical protein C8J55DRAFT_492569 [Lentinula edodes]|uniref:Uncharacterized protein n=1 Tax=Lentinula lateritia TaxID=40482 RepID=A0A9W8ZUY2_9AGAR|nr:hypothetical protein C8J55DRAFT_492569 [Lentinula edodes]